MNQALLTLIEANRKSLEQRGFTISIKTGQLAGDYSVDIDSPEFVGTICSWTSGAFEFQFNDCATGAVLLLETKYFETMQELREYFDQLLYRLPKPSAKSE